MKFDKAISDAAQAAGIKLTFENGYHLSFIDRGGRTRGFYKSAFGWVEAEKTGQGWRVTVRRGSGPLLERPVSGMSRGVKLDEAAAGAADVFPSVVAVIRATMPAADVRKPSRLARWFGLSAAQAA
ncbi:hypothetical protein [uncultured Nitratireductor sp.]|uniref:hypothetical protein n=1 Tax=uncultured Nitratireductor sp. TaxID=520953 RepID=UPI0025FA2F7D|nr:hypothetical protein [uncultured Nitratireductor sp.]